jgi:VLTF3-like late transcription factor
MKKFQGKHNIDVENLNSVVNEIKREISLHNLTPAIVTKDQIYTFLSENKLSGYYDDIHLIYHLITGKPCADFSYLEPLLLELFETQEAALDDTADEIGTEDSIDNTGTRINSINVYYKLYKLLQKAGYPCKKADFYILKTRAKEDEHDEKMMRAWRRIGWSWIDTY